MKGFACVTASEAQTEFLGEELARGLRAGSILLLYGGLGAGKTAFVRGLVRGLHGDETQVSSPTFTIMQQYEANLPVYHFDLYRLGDEEELYGLGFEEYLPSADGVSAVEWPGLGEEIFRECPIIKITIENVDDGEKRLIQLEGEYADLDIGRLQRFGIRCAL